jgi:hypothetical protein
VHRACPSSSAGKRIYFSDQENQYRGDRKVYEPLTKLSLDENSPWFVVKHCLCDYHMIYKLFKTKVSVNDKNKALLGYAKRWVNTWCNSLETEEECKHAYHQCLAFVDSDLAKEGRDHAHAQILEGYLVESSHQKEHRMVKYVSMDTRSFEVNTSAHA